MRKACEQSLASVQFWEMQIILVLGQDLDSVQYWEKYNRIGRPMLCFCAILWKAYHRGLRSKYSFCVILSKVEGKGVMSRLNLCIVQRKADTTGVRPHLVGREYRFEVKASVNLCAVLRKLDNTGEWSCWGSSHKEYMCEIKVWGLLCIPVNQIMFTTSKQPPQQVPNRDQTSRCLISNYSFTHLTYCIKMLCYIHPVIVCHTIINQNCFILWIMEVIQII